MRPLARRHVFDPADRLPFIRSLSITLVIAGLVLPGLTFADTQEVQLQRLRARIERLQRGLNATVGKRDSTRDELQTAERRINELLQSLHEIDGRLRAQAQTIDKLKRRERRERDARHNQIRALETQIRTAYAIGRQPYLKILLSQENPAAASRVLAYYRYFNAARVARIDKANTTLNRLKNLQSSIDQQTRELTDLREIKENEHRALEGSRRRRTALLANLNQRVANQSEEIARLRGDEQRLERLVRELKAMLPEAHVPFPGANERFASLKGRLPLPLAGRVVARYGQSKGVGNLTWRGIFIAGKEGQTVRAVSRGRVAFADWLRGFGLLLILDHGDGYMTLYGYNEALQRHTGDWVEAGQPIAIAGNTGDAPATGVYFEIRHNGVPRDPLRWCATGPIRSNRARR